MKFDALDERGLWVDWVTFDAFCQSDWAGGLSSSRYPEYWQAQHL